jgi:DNA polymerase III subunit delta
VKASKATIGRAVDQPGESIRLYLFYGPDEAQSRALAARLLDGLGATKAQLAGGAVKSGAASLTDEAGAMSLFGGKRLIWVEPANDDIIEGAMALLDGPAGENPVVAIAGALKKSSALVKLAEGSPIALAFQAYPPEGRDAERMIVDVGRRFGLNVPPAVAARLADSCGNDQAIAGQELDKLALFLDASPHRPKELDDSAIEAVGANDEGDHSKLADLALAGEVEELAAELARLPAGGSEAIPVLRSLQRRLLMLAPLRARVERGERIDGVMASLGKALFWKDKAKVQRMLGKWNADALATVGERAGKLERSLIFTAAPEREALGEELLAIARRARSR